jgi:hypothetical protein
MHFFHEAFLNMGKWSVFVGVGCVSLRIYICGAAQFMAYYFV